MSDLDSEDRRRLIRQRSADAAQQPAMMISGKGARAKRNPRRPPVRLSIKIERGEARTWSRHHQGIVKDERGQQQPADQKRARDNR